MIKRNLPATKLLFYWQATSCLMKCHKKMALTWMVMTSLLLNGYAQSLPQASIKPFSINNPNYQSGANTSEGEFLVHQAINGNIYTISTASVPSPRIEIGMIDPGNGVAFAWAHRFTANGGNLRWGIPFTSPGHEVNFVGQFSGNTDFDPGPSQAIIGANDEILWLQYTPDGSFVFGKTLTENRSTLGSIYCAGTVGDAEGNLYVMSVIYNGRAKDFDPGPGEALFTSTTTAEKYQVGVLAKYSPTGALLWAKEWSYALGANSPKYLKFVNNKLFIVTTFSGEIDADPDAGVTTFDSPNNILVARYNVDGQLEKAFAIRAYLGDYHVLPNNDVVLTGHYQNQSNGEVANADLDPSEATFFFRTAPNLYTAFAAHYAADGTLVKPYRLSHGKAMTVPALFVSQDQSEIWIGGNLETGSIQYYSNNIPYGGAPYRVSSGYLFEYASNFELKSTHFFGSGGGTLGTALTTIFTNADQKLTCFGRYRGQLNNLDPTNDQVILNGNAQYGDVFAATFCTVLGKPSPSTAWAQYIKPNSTNNTLQVSAVAGATGYTWSLPAGFTITSGANTNAITFDVSETATNGTIRVASNNTCSSGFPHQSLVTVGTKELATLTFDNITKTIDDPAFTLQATSNSTGVITYEKLDDQNDVITLIGNVVKINHVGTVHLLARVAEDATLGSGVKEISLTVTKSKLKVIAHDKVREFGDDVALTYNIESVEPPKGNALSFDGVDDQVVIENVHELSSTAYEITVEAWVKMSALTNNSEFIRSGSSDGFRFFIYGGYLNVGVTTETGGSLTFYGTNPITPNQWNHIAFTYKAGEGFVTYINGVEDRRSPVYTFGIRGSSTRQLQFRLANEGAIDNVRIWNVARSAIEIRESKSVSFDNTTPRLIAYYNFDQGVAEGTNTGLTNIVATKGPHGVLQNFDLAGAKSNWVNGVLSQSEHDIDTNPGIATSATIDSPPGTYDIQVSGAVDDIYDFDYTPGTLTILKKQLQVTMESKTTNYTGSVQTLLATSSPVAATITMTYNGSVTQPIDVGTYTVIASINDTNYTGSTTGTLVIEKAPQTITFAPLDAKRFGDNPFGFTATSSSNLSVLFESSDPSVVSISDNTATIHKTGTVTITANQHGNQNYLPAVPVTQQLIVGKAFQTITFSDLPNTHIDEATLQLTATSTSGLPVTYIGSHPEVATISGDIVTFHKPGTIAIAANQAGNENYEAAIQVAKTLTILKKEQTITFGPLWDRVVGEAPFALIATSTSNLPITFTSSNNDVASIEDNIVTLHGEGTVMITAQQDGDEMFGSASAEQSMVVRLVTAAEGPMDSVVSVYPNPAADKIIIVSTASGEVEVVTMHDTTGRGVMLNLTTKEAGVYEADISSLPQGLYTIHIQTRKTLQSVKFIKK